MKKNNYIKINIILTTALCVLGLLYLILEKSNPFLVTPMKIILTTMIMSYLIITCVFLKEKKIPSIYIKISMIVPLIFFAIYSVNATNESINNRNAMSFEKEMMMIVCILLSYVNIIEIFKEREQ